MTGLLLFIITVVSWLPLTILNGWVLTHLWTWFVVPVFALPVLTLGQAIGLSLVVSFFMLGQTLYLSNDDSDEEFVERILKMIIFGLIQPPIFLFFGWVYLGVFF